MIWIIVQWLIAALVMGYALRLMIKSQSEDKECRENMVKYWKLVEDEHRVIREEMEMTP
jgi:hypothetical protein